MTRSHIHIYLHETLTHNTFSHSHISLSHSHIQATNNPTHSHIFANRCSPCSSNQRCHHLPQYHMLQAVAQEKSSLLVTPLLTNHHKIDSRTRGGTKRGLSHYRVNLLLPPPLPCDTYTNNFELYFNPRFVFSRFKNLSRLFLGLCVCVCVCIKV